jgi:PAS domain S-box-containing protein
MARRASSDRDRGNGVQVRALRAGHPQRVAPAAADFHGVGTHNGAAAGHAAEARLRSEAELAFAVSIVESSNDAIIVTTLDGVITSWNAGAERVCGYSAREVLGRWLIEMIVPEGGLPEILERVGRSERVDPYETVWVRKDRRCVDVSVTVSPIRGSDGRIVGASLIARDITHRNHAEAAIRELDILRYVAGLAAAAAHEINNPLTVIVGYVQLLADEVDATGRGRVDEMLRAVSRIQEIVTRMARVTRVELTEKVLYLPEMLDLTRSSEPLQ